MCRLVHIIEMMNRLVNNSNFYIQALGSIGRQTSLMKGREGQCREGTIYHLKANLSVVCSQIVTASGEHDGIKGILMNSYYTQ